MTGVRILKLDLSSAVVLFRDVNDECRTACPGANLTHGLRIRLERLTKEERKNIVNQKNDGCSPLFVAAKRGNTEIVEYLIKTCDSDVEEKGLYQVPDDQSIHKVSPLWCAAVAGRLQVVKCLVKYGANVNCVSDTGSTPVRSACFMTYYEIVKFLVESGADISIPNYNGGTCLINSVQSVPLCQYLLEKGASVNAVDIQNKTALHYAIQEHRLETAKLLIRFGADPFIMSRNGDDALQTACLKGATQIFDYLINEISYPIDRIADAHELMGSTFLDEHNDVQIALTYWRSAVQIRNVDPSGPIQKPLLPLNPSYGNIKEFETLDELDNMAGDLETMRIQSIMVCERILGCKHKDLIFRLMFRGAAYADALRYDICISLWRRALELRIHRDTLLYNEAVFTAQALARLFIDLQTKPQDGLSDFRLDVADVLSTWRILMEHLPESRRMLETRPIWKRHEECFDRLLKVISHLVYVFAAMPRQEIVRCGILQEIHNLLSMDLRTSSGDTLLHLAVSADNCIKHSGYADETPILCFPDLHVTQLLIACGARIDSQNARGSTPLHVSSVPGNLKMEILNTLLSSGAHIDQRNICEERPLDFLRIYPRTPHSLIFSHENLKCLSARVLAANRIPYHGRVPKPLEDFIAMH